MEIIEKIVGWAKGKPLWQQIIIADILKGKDCTDEEVATYASLALEEVVDPEAIIGRYGNPLEKYIYKGNGEAESVILEGISDTVNINDIPDGSSFDFGGQGLNIIFGNNAAGKSGYTRVLKGACMSRHDEKVCGSIYRDDGAESSAKVNFRRGSTADSYSWSANAAANANLKTVNVFDTMSGKAYLTGQTDIKYKPAGMDVLDRLAEIVQRIDAHLRKEEASKQLQLKNLDPVFAEYEGTKAYALIGALDKKGAPELLQKLSQLDETEKAALTKLEVEIPERERLAPAKYRDNLTKVTGRLNRIAIAARTLSQQLQKQKQEAVKTALKQMNSANKIAAKAKSSKFDSSGYVPGTGGDLWKVMWEAAAEFSSKIAYPDHEFPHTTEGAKCPLCQQALKEDAPSRMKGFAAYVSDKSQENAQNRKVEYEDLVQAFNESRPDGENIESMFSDVSEDDYASINEVRKAFGNLVAHHDRHADAIESGKPLVEDLDLASDIKTIQDLEKHIATSREELAKPLDDQKYRDDLANDKLKLKGLKARQLLAAHETSIRSNIDVHISLTAYASALEKCNTYSISAQSRTLTTDHVLAELEKSFNAELGKIFTGRIKAQLVQAPTRYGVPHSEIVLTANGSRSRERIESIMSEGEQRGLALAGFFTELSMMPHASAIIFDDPITSLDDENAAKIAKRLIEASKKRQVVVFTHRITFVTQLIDEAKRQGVKDIRTKTVSKLAHPGIVEDKMPWDAMSVKDRLGWLKNNFQAVLGPLYRDNKAEEYQEKGEFFYKRLREAWERAIEELLFGDVVKRHSRNVSTQQLRMVKYRPDDNLVVDENMSRCSEFVHDSARESTVPVPALEAVEGDLNKFIEWVDELKQR